MRTSSVQPQVLKTLSSNAGLMMKMMKLYRKNHEEGQRRYPRERSGHLVRESHCYHRNLWEVTEMLSE